MQFVYTVISYWTFSLNFKGPLRLIRVKSIILITSRVKQNLKNSQEPRHNQWWTTSHEENVKAPRCLTGSGTMKEKWGMWCPSFHISQQKELKLRTRTWEAAKRTREDKQAKEHWSGWLWKLPVGERFYIWLDSGRLGDWTRSLDWRGITSYWTWGGKRAPTGLFG